MRWTRPSLGDTATHALFTKECWKALRHWPLQQNLNIVTTTFMWLDTGWYGFTAAAILSFSALQSPMKCRRLRRTTEIAAWVSGAAWVAIPSSCRVAFPRSRGRPPFSFDIPMGITVYGDRLLFVMRKLKNKSLHHLWAFGSGNVMVMDAIEFRYWKRNHGLLNISLVGRGWNLTWGEHLQSRLHPPQSKVILHTHRLFRKRWRDYTNSLTGFHLIRGKSALSYQA